MVNLGQIMASDAGTIESQRARWEEGVKAQGDKSAVGVSSDSCSMNYQHKSPWELTQGVGKLNVYGLPEEPTSFFWNMQVCEGRPEVTFPGLEVPQIK